MLMPNTNDFALAVEQWRKQRAEQQKREKKTFNQALIAVGELVDLKAHEPSFEALVGAFQEAAARLADPAARQRLEALGAAKIASKIGSTDPQQDLVVVLPAPAAPAVAAGLEALGLRGGADLHDGQQTWMGCTVTAEVAALVGPAGGVVTVVQLPPAKPASANIANKRKRATPAEAPMVSESEHVEVNTSLSSAPLTENAAIEAAVATAEAVAVDRPETSGAVEASGDAGKNDADTIVNSSGATTTVATPRATLPPLRPVGPFDFGFHDRDKKPAAADIGARSGGSDDANKAFGLASRD
jgi:hypothetical protein